MYNQKLRDKDYLTQLHKNFSTAKPFPFVCIDNFLEPDVAAALAQNFPASSEMDVTYNGLNEKKREHSDFNKLHEDYSLLKNKLFSKEFVSIIEKITGIENLFTIDDRFGCGLSQGGKGSFLDIHIDYNLHPIQKKQRRINLILFLNKEWKEEWGGHMEFWDAEGKNCVSRVLPSFNRCVLFICNKISYHGYQSIECPENVHRQSLYLYFFSKPEKNILFHDTVFTSTPGDSIWRKQLVRGKEFAKTTVKRILYYSGLNKFLK